MNRIATVSILLAAAVLASTSCDRAKPPENTVAKPAPAALPDLAPPGATLLDGLGDYRMPISTSQAQAQRWFDQGLMLTYGFNHDAAERSFLKAAELDPDCAMCWWGAALVLGPHVNAAMDPARNGAALERVQKAQALAPKASEREQAYIAALATRYAADPPTDRKPLDQAYAAAMGDMSRRFPEDVDAATLHAESLMNLQPWDFWNADGSPKGETAQIVAILESVMRSAPKHAGALHLYVHAVEASAEPERGVAAADTLRGLFPGSGHLVHMPAHIYARVGRWRDAAAVNRDAIKADDAYLAACRPAPGVYPLGYVPHNHHFLWFASSMIGDSATALAAAEATAERTSNPELMRAPGLEAMQNFAMTPMFARVRFGRWQEVAGTPQPAADLPLMNAMWHYAQAIAALRTGRPDEASSHHESLITLSSDPALKSMMAFDRYPLSLAVGVAERVVAAELAAAQNDFEASISMLREAVVLEEAIPYDEPPGWHQPVRQILGAVLLDAKQASDAEREYLAELRRNPENGWSLKGLALALQAQGREAEAADVERRFAQAWGDSDVALTASRF